MPAPYLQHLTTAQDLVTPHEATRKGFIEWALEKNVQATPTINKARALRVEAAKAGTPEALAKVPTLQAALLLAAGLSDKAARHLEATDKQTAVKGLVENFLTPAGADWIDELTYRFLLSSGDALGGAMRNVIGAIAKARFTGLALGALTLANRPYSWQDLDAKNWTLGTAAYAGIERRVRAISYKAVDGTDRILVYNVRVPLVKKNIDAVLIRSNTAGMQGAINNPNSYLALGELKGGIDPAGADEHWKTGNTALSRVRREFAGAQATTLTFFVGGAIVTGMAQEIWSQLQTSQLANAANLTNPNQVASLVGWLVSL